MKCSGTSSPDHGNVWLTSDQGRLLAAARGLDRLDLEFGDKGFLRVHRRFLVNLSRVREIEPGFKGALFLATDTRSHESVLGHCRVRGRNRLAIPP